MKIFIRAVADVSFVLNAGGLGSFKVLMAVVSDMWDCGIRYVL